MRLDEMYSWDCEIANASAFFMGAEASAKDLCGWSDGIAGNRINNLQYLQWNTEILTRSFQKWAACVENNMGDLSGIVAQRCDEMREVMQRYVRYVKSYVKWHLAALNSLNNLE